MAMFKHGSWRGTQYWMSPSDWRKIFPRKWTPPYFAGNRIEFHMEVNRTSHDAPRLNELQIWEVIPESEARLLPTNQVESDDKTSCDFPMETEIIPVGRVQYLLGEPGGVDSHILIRADMLSSDTAIMWATQTIVGAIIGSVIGLAIGAIVTLLALVLKGFL
ncbi:hypothetical protein ACFLVX_03870 [Chloroflexota bacterium]